MHTSLLIRTPTQHQGRFRTRVILRIIRREKSLPYTHNITAILFLTTSTTIQRLPFYWLHHDSGISSPRPWLLLPTAQAMQGTATSLVGKRSGRRKPSIPTPSPCSTRRHANHKAPTLYTQACKSQSSHHDAPQL